MKTKLFTVCLLSSMQASAAFVVSDSTAYVPAPTTCGWVLDSQPKVVLPVALDAANHPFCRYDLAAVVPGSHTVTTTFQVSDPVFGLLESAPSVALTFSVPSKPGVPLNMRLIK
jgi:hypothetical protein